MNLTELSKSAFRWSRSALVFSLLLAICISIIPAGTAYAQGFPPGEKPPVGDNPDLAPACGINVILVLDESGSIQNTGGAEAAVRNAATAFVNALADTGSAVAIVEFGSEAKMVFDYTSVTSGAGGTIDTLFDPYINATGISGDEYDAPSQLGPWTNWDDALDEVEAINADSGVAPLVVFVTDGDPTAFNLDYSGESGGVATNQASNPQSLWRAMEEANAVKAQGSHLLVVGVGNGLNNAASQQRLRDISGDDEFTGSPDELDIEIDDVARVTDFADLEAALRQVAFDLCAPSLTFTKLADDDGDGTFGLAQGWEFNADVEAPIPGGINYAWVLPAGATPGSQVSVTTGNDGTATLQWEPEEPINSQITFDETIQPDFVFVDASCLRKTLTSDGVTETSFTLNSLPAVVVFGPNDIVTCEVRNQFVPDPSLTINKMADVQNFDEVGDIINYTIVATNNGNTTLENVTVTDPAVTGLSCTPANGSSLDPGDTMTCTASHLVTQADIDAGSYLNIACVDDGEGGAEEVCDDVEPPALQDPDLEISKVVAEQNFSAVGDILNFTIVATNTGNVTLDSVTVTDEQVSDLSCSPTNGSALAPGAEMTCTATHTVTQEDIDAGSFFNEACVDDGEGGAAEVCDDVEPPALQDPDLEISKVVAEQNFSAVGDILNFTIVATNTGNVTLDSVTVTDEQVSDLSCTPANGSSLAPGAEMTCTATHTVTQEDIDAGSFFNEACVDDGEGGAAEVCDDVEPPALQDPDLEISKVVAEENFSAVGDILNFTIVATNTGSVTLDSVTVTDEQVSDLSCTPANGSSLTPGAIMTCTASHTVTQEDIDAGSFFNEACVDDGEGGAAEVCDDVELPALQDPKLQINKMVAEQNFSAVGDVLNFTIEATNTGNVTLDNVTVTDEQVSDLSCTPANGSSLAPGAIMTCTASHTVTQEDIDAGSFFNEACVDDGEGGAVEVCDDVDVPGLQDPAIEIVKTAADGLDFQIVDVGDDAVFTITVTNTGNVTLSNVVVTDPLAPNCDNVIGNLEVGETQSYNCTVVVDDDFTNIATVDGEGPQGQPVEDEDPSDVVVIFDVCEDGKPDGLTLLYTGLGPDGTDNSQAGNEVILEGDADDQDPAYIVVFDHKKKNPNLIFEGEVSIGQKFDVTGTQNKIPPRMKFLIYTDNPDDGGVLLETVQFHTSCSQPLFGGDGFGSILLAGEFED